jgi:hypothetical protein
MEARRISLEASTCRQPVPQATIDHWKRQIKEASAKLSVVDGKIGETNKSIRATKATSNQANKRAIKSLAQLPTGMVAPSIHSLGGKVSPNNAIEDNPKQGRVLFLQFFLQLAEENLDPRQFAVLEKDAHGLVTEFRRAHSLRGEKV